MVAAFREDAVPIDLEIAKKVPEKEEANLVVVREGGVVFIGYSKGLRDVAEIVLEKPNILRGASIADRVVGKAVATICAVRGVRAVYGGIMSMSGLKVLREKGVKARYDRLVEFIEAERGGICPFEELVLDVEEIEDAYELLLERFKRVFGRGGKRYLRGSV